jgi:Ca2+-binding EF-hand superfamily protein
MGKYVILCIIALGAGFLYFLPAITSQRKPVSATSSISSAQVIQQINKDPVAQPSINVKPGPGAVEVKMAPGRVIDLNNLVQSLKRDAGKAGPQDTKSSSPTQKTAGKSDPVLPNGLPAWFDALDKNEDGQVSLSEWLAGGRKLEEFRKYDRNGDGLITLEEVLGHLKKSINLKLVKGRATFNSAISGSDEKYQGKKLSKVFTVFLDRDKTYQFDHISQAFDAYLYLEDPDGNIVAEDDDSGGGNNARIVYQADKTGLHRVIATSLDGNGTGAFTLLALTIGDRRNLPKGLPAWFKALDKEGTGQISLHQWKRTGKSLGEFREIDLNSDGIITLEEVLAHTKKLVDLKLERDQVFYDGSLEETIDDLYQGKKAFKALTISLEKGKTYLIEQTSKDFFAYLCLEDSDGKTVGKHNSGGLGQTARIVHQASKTGTYRIIATSQGGYKTGAFSLGVRVIDSPGAGAAKGLPSWFKTLDSDGDGQISLFEWRQNGKPIEEFQKYDLNGDGFITAQELLRHMNMKAPLELRPQKGLVNYNGTIDATDEKYQGRKRAKIFTLQVEKGNTYEITMVSQDFNAYLYLEDPDGTILDKNLGGDKGMTSRIVYRATESGAYRVIATSQLGTGIGSFAISVRVRKN